MIETGLVYIYSVKPTKHFIGCGVLIEGGYVATYRHVWRMATANAEWEAGEQPTIEIRYPFSKAELIQSSAAMVDACQGLDRPDPDLVLLEPDEIPDGVMSVPLAREDRFQVGEGRIVAALKGRVAGDPNAVSDVEVRGEIAGFVRSDGRRQFTGSNQGGYWTDRGSSGSPVFLGETAMQLAGILSLSETGPKPGESPIHVAFVVPATTIHRYMARLMAKPVAAEERIKLADLQQILDQIGARDLPVAEIPTRLKQFVEAARSHGAEPVRPSDGADIDPGTTIRNDHSAGMWVTVMTPSAASVA